MADSNSAVGEPAVGEAARYRSLVEAMEDVVWRTDALGRAVDVGRWPAIFGYAREEVTGYGWQRVVHPDDLPAVVAEWRAALEDRRPYDVVCRLQLADGRYRRFRTRGVPIRGGDGRVAEWVGVSSDVEEALAAEEALRASEARLERERALLAEAQRIGRIGSWSWDLVTGETRVSDEVYRMFGVAPDQVRTLGANAVDTFDALLAPEDRARAVAQRRAVWAAREPSSSGQWRAVRPDGRAVVVVTRSEWRYDAAGRPVYASGTVQDVTEQAAADEALRASEERFRLVGRATRDVLYDYDVASGAVWASDAMPVALRLADDVVVDHAWWQGAMHPDDVARVRDSLAATLAGTNETAVTEYRMRRGDGTWATVVDRAYVVRHPDGGARRVIGALADISEQRELEAQLRHAQKMEAVGQLAGGVAHDFNNLLSAILAGAELSRAAAPPGSVLAADLEEIVQAARRGARLTRQLLAFGRRQVLRPRLLDLAAVVRGAEPLVRRLLPETVALDFALPEESSAAYLVHADPGQVEQVLMNLVVNARDAIAAVAAPAAAGAAADDPARGPGLVQVGVDAVDGHARLTVRDDGIGMDAATRARVFEPFFTTKEPGRGTGLGLSTAYGIVAQSGGTILVASEPGLGTTFSVLLPTAASTPGAAPAPAAAPDAAAPRAGGETVLLVEDEAAVRRMARRLLERSGYRVLEARHGADALLVWDEHGGAVDVVLTDLRMPEMGGHELIERLRARRPALPAVLMSGYVRDPAGGTIVGPPVPAVDKPFTADELLRVVRGVLGSDG